MKLRKSLPEINRLSIVSAAIILAFGLTQLVSFPAQQISFGLIGILIEFTMDFNTVVTILTVMLAAAGMHWLILSHPDHDQYQAWWEYVRHWIVPVMTTIVIGVALNEFAGEPYWWVIFLMGSLGLIAVFIAEFNVVAADSFQHPLAAIGLTGLSFALFLLLSIAVYSAGMRLYIRIPLLGVGAMMVISRSLYLRLGKWHTLWSLIGSLIVSEIAVGFHYLPLSPTQFGLMLVGAAYALTGIVSGIEEARKGLAFWGEPLAMLALTVLVGLV